MLVEPIPDAPAAIATCGDERALVVADYHAGIEDGLRVERGVSLDSAAGERRERLLSLVDAHAPDRIVFLGDLLHSLGEPGGPERGELEVLFEQLDVPVTLVKGNHDGAVESWLDDQSRVTVTSPHGVRLGDVGFAHGHTWPSREVLAADVVCVGHEHPSVRLEDEVGGRRVERAWLRGPLSRDPFDARYERETEPGIEAWSDPELVVFPAYNDRSGGTWVNVSGQAFLAPFLPDALPEGQAYLLDGTRVGSYRHVA